MTTMLAWSTDPDLRHNASSGGFTRAMLRWMLAEDLIDRALIVRTGPREGGFRPEAIATANPEELADRRTASVYYPVSPLSVPLDPRLLYAATLLPCQVAALRSMQRQGFFGEIGYVFELLCHHTPTPEFTAAVCRELGVENPQSVVYRGNGWPGEVEVDGRRAAQPRMWGTHGAAMLHRCRACRRTHGPDSDWVVADPWLIAGTMGDGKTLVRVGTPAGAELFAGATGAGAIQWEPVADSEWARRMALHANRRDAK